jgi:hypothetical protein
MTCKISSGKMPRVMVTNAKIDTTPTNKLFLIATFS